MILQDMIDAVKADLDIDEGSSISNLASISDEDIKRWINKGIRAAEQQIHTLYEDYFLSYEKKTITSGTVKYDYPVDTYANKIRKIIFDSGNQEVMEVKRTRNLVNSTANDILFSDTSEPFLTWTPLNSSAGRKIQLFPVQGRSGYLHIWYIRNAKQLKLPSDTGYVAGDDVCDIDEFEEYVVQYAKVQAMLKDKLPIDEEMAILVQMEGNMVSTLSDMVPDQNNELIADISFYQESV
jgi:hypothetical protein